MLLFLCNQEQKNQLNDEVNTSFDGKTLRTYVGKNLYDERPAKIGESYSIEYKNSNLSITKNNWTSSRGKQFCWALSFNKKKIARNYDDFLKKFETYKILYPGCLCLVSAPNRFGIISKVNSKGKQKPLFIFVADDLNTVEVHSLISAYQILFKETYCPERFLKNI